MLVALVALSGGATLAGEALGARALRPMLGSTALAQTGTLVGVLGALGAGAWWAGGLLAQGRVSARRVLVGAHVALALWALAGAALPEVITNPLAQVLVPLSLRTPVAGDLTRFALAVLFTAIPGALAGSVYPAAVALLARGAGAGTAIAGAASSLGSAAAALATTFLLCPTFGVSRTLGAVALAYGLVALVASRWRTEPPIASTSATIPRVEGARAVVVALGLVGVASTAWQVLLSRAGALAFGPSAFTFAAALAAHVTALALGELAVLRFVARSDRAGARDALGLVAVVATLGAAAGAALLRAMPTFAEALLQHGAPPQYTLWLSAYGALTVAALPVAGCAGAAMALAARALAPDESHGAPEANGAALAAAAVGNVLGAVVTTFAVMPALNVTGAAFAVAATLVCAVALARSPTAAVVAAGLGALVALRVGVESGAEMLRGAFLYAGGRDVELGRVAWRRDGPEATVAVRRDDEGHVLLQINGKVDATSLGDATTQTVVGIVPVAMAREPRDVLVVGLGSGMTVDAVRSVPGVRSVEVAELVGDVVRAARYDFARANHHCLDDRRVRVLEADAAHYLRGSPRRYDAIVSEPSNPWVAGMSDLFTREALVAARDHLRPGGAFGQWFHAYGTSPEVVASIVATFREVFPRATLMEVSPGMDYLLVGLREPARLDLDAFLSRTADPTVARMLAAANLADRPSLLARFLAGSRGVAAVAGDASSLRASDLSLEFRAPSLLYRDATADVFALLARVDDLPLAGLGVDTTPGGTWLRLLDESEGHREAAAHTRNMVLAQREGDLARALREGDLAVGLAPDDLALRAMLARLYLLRSTARKAAHDPGAAEQDLLTVLELAPPPTERLRALVRLGDMSLRRRDGRRALARYEEATRIVREAHETAPELRVRTAEALAMLGAPAQAAEELDRAIDETRDPTRRVELEALRRGTR